MDKEYLEDYFAKENEEIDKFYKTLAWKKLFQPEGEAKLNKWIEQAQITTKPYWIVIFKINNAGSYCVVDRSVADELEFEMHDCYMTYRNDYVILDMKAFFEKNYKRIIDENNRNK